MSNGQGRGDEHRMKGRVMDGSQRCSMMMILGDLRARSQTPRNRGIGSRRAGDLPAVVVEDDAQYHVLPRCFDAKRARSIRQLNNRGDWPLHATLLPGAQRRMGIQTQTGIRWARNPLHGTLDGAPIYTAGRRRLQQELWLGGQAC